MFFQRDLAVVQQGYYKCVKVLFLMDVFEESFLGGGFKLSIL